MPKYKGINIHPSCLPNYRGGDVNRWQIYKGSRTTGITIHLINEKFDSGVTILQKKILLKEKNPIKLNKKLSLIASKMIKKLLNQNIDFKDFKKKKLVKIITINGIG